MRVDNPTADSWREHVTRVRELLAEPQCEDGPLGSELQLAIQDLLVADLHRRKALRIEADHKSADWIRKLVRKDLSLAADVRSAGSRLVLDER